MTRSGLKVEISYGPGASTVRTVRTSAVHTTVSGRRRRYRTVQLGKLIRARAISHRRAGVLSRRFNFLLSATVARPKRACLPVHEQELLVAP
jgi:hypothetical protein